MEIKNIQTGLKFRGHFIAKFPVNSTIEQRQAWEALQKFNGAAMDAVKQKLSPRELAEYNKQGLYYKNLAGIVGIFINDRYHGFNNSIGLDIFCLDKYNKTVGEALQSAFAEHNFKTDPKNHLTLHRLVSVKIPDSTALEQAKPKRLAVDIAN